MPMWQSRDLLGEMDLTWGFGPEWFSLCCLIDPWFNPFFMCFSSFSVPHALFHCIPGAGGRSCQPPARPGRTDSHWRADNWTAVIPWWIPARREARHPRSALESCQPAGPWETPQVTYPWKHTGCCVTYGLIDWLTWSNMDFDTYNTCLDCIAFGFTV